MGESSRKSRPLMLICWIVVLSLFILAVTLFGAPGIQRAGLGIAVALVGLFAGTLLLMAAVYYRRQGENHGPGPGSGENDDGTP